ncbi:hypothetical protein WJX72_006528 [[Myrmecia] bisecta]|uniref:PPM-type phosphatase domain-containing protein n=1 Tax=[Myrmecia] bisecta TaxID=41462 RepID=A0AAW1PX09_9CHLO
MFAGEDVTRDHKPDIPQEQSRILDSGGDVRRMVDPVDGPVGPFRVWVKGGRFPGLAMSRSAGDSIAKSVGVVAEAETRGVTCSPGDILLLASDGVWEFLSTQQALDLVTACETLEQGAAALVKESCRLWLADAESDDPADQVCDDITVVLMRIPEDPLEVVCKKTDPTPSDSA